MPGPVPLTFDPAATQPQCRQPALFRFGLRNLLLSMGALSVLFGAMSAVGGMLALALLLLTIVVAAHVLSTFVGTRLRDGSTAASAWEAASGRRPLEPYLAIDSRRPATDAGEKGRVRHLQGHGLFVRWMLIAVAACGLVGAAACAVVMAALLWPKIGVPGIVAGAIAGGILAAWAAFLGLSFYIILRRAWREAVEGSIARPVARRGIASASTVPNQS
jgi:hypothetical protein